MSLPDSGLAQNRIGVVGNRFAVRLVVLCVWGLLGFFLASAYTVIACVGRLGTWSLLLRQAQSLPGGSTPQ